MSRVPPKSNHIYCPDHRRGMLQNLAPGEVSVGWHSSKGSEETFETQPGFWEGPWKGMIRPEPAVSSRGAEVAPCSSSKSSS